MTDQLKDQIKERAKQLGFDLCGIAPAVSPVSLPHFQNWLDAGFAGEMQYIPNREQAYQHPKYVLPTVRSVIMTATCYSQTTADHNNGDGRIAKYAQGDLDYHDVVRKMLKQLANYLHEISPQCVTRAVIDTAPLLERDFARMSGLGWFGKNTLLINKSIGSNFFIGAVLTDIDLPADASFQTNHCGTCTRCLDVCPTDALTEEYVLDARKCISYHTIEQRKTPIPLEFRPGIQDWIFGCDLCQEVCPWNRHAPDCSQPSLIAMPEQQPDAVDFLEMNDDEFRKRFKKSPLWRTGRIALARNAAIVIGNSGETAHLSILSKHLHDENELIRGAVIWAMGQIGNAATAIELQNREKVETDDSILNEITLAQQIIASKM